AILILFSEPGELFANFALKPPVCRVIIARLRHFLREVLLAGGDPLYVARRCLAIASEDVGNADPRAMQVAISAWDCFTRVG
uniref:AAA family ATPase n=1 Tax=Klebsiella pneumoniae TaxID=573 RepID=UPI00404429EE